MLQKFIFYLSQKPVLYYYQLRVFHYNVLARIANPHRQITTTKLVTRNPQHSHDSILKTHDSFSGSIFHKTRFYTTINLGISITMYWLALKRVPVGIKRMGDYLYSQSSIISEVCNLFKACFNALSLIKPLIERSSLSASHCTPIPPLIKVHLFNCSCDAPVSF
jgi:hypothetical protein